MRFVRPRRALVGRALIAPALLALVVSGCGDSDGNDSAGATPSGSASSATPSAGASSSGPTGTLTVLAAASLTESFDALAEKFESEHPGVTIRFSYGPSSGLARQIVEGAKADVFASASPATMETVTKAGRAEGEPTVFASNLLEIAVPKGNPGKVQGLADLGKSSLRVALCAEQVPCGAAALKAFKAANVTPKPDTLEQDVKAVLAKVKLGEVDAGLVYHTDVKSAGDSVAGIAFPEAKDAINKYPIVVLRDAPQPELAAQFVEAVLGADGRAALGEAGFELP